MTQPRVRYIFTYGTLMSCCTGRQGAFERMQMQTFARVVGDGSIRGRVFDAGACPAAVLTIGKAEDRVRGEIWQLPADQEAAASLLTVLDAYEGCRDDSPRPFPYVRRRIRVRTPDGRRVTAWMYQWVRPTRGLPLVPDGTWREPKHTVAAAACSELPNGATRHRRMPA